MASGSVPTHAETLRGLAALSGDGAPEVRLGLHSGTTLVGRVAAMSEHGVSLFTEGQRLSVVDVARVEWIETTLTTATRRVLGMREPRMGDNPSKVDLRRRAQQIAAARTVAVGAPCTITLPWENMPPSADARGDLGDLLDLLHACIQRISGGPLGAAALRPIRTVSIRMGEVGVSREGDTLHVRVSTDGSRLDLPRDLMMAIEAVL